MIDFRTKPNSIYWKLAKAQQATMTALGIKMEDLEQFPDVDNERFYAWRAIYKDTLYVWTYNRATEQVTFSRKDK